MSNADWLILECMALGWVHGIWVGWYVWRRPVLKERMKND